MNLEEGFGTHTKETEKELDATDNPYAEAVKKEVRDQYMMGPSILVAPLFSDDNGRSVILPEGNWYDFYTGAYAGNGEIITVSGQFEKIPLFVKDGGIIPMIPPIRQTREWKQQIPLEIRVYGEKPGEFVLYDDDGTSFNYEKGDYTTRLLKTNAEKGSIENIHNSEHWVYGDVHWNFLQK
jgi:alpha-D-xyloside xylohydrolase